MVIDGKEYTSDLIIFRDTIKSSWWRLEGHMLLPQDLEDVWNEKPEILVVGTGASGLMRISPHTLKALEAHHIELRSDKHGKAVTLFNALSHEHHVAGAFHLTC